MDTCKFESCTRVVYSVTTGYCRSHNAQLKRGGELKPLRGEVVICNHDGCPYRAAGLLGDNPELLRKLADVVAKPPRFPREG